MSTEALLISAVVDEGATALRQVYSAGITSEFFSCFDEEWRFVERRAARKKPINLRTLRESFPDFDYQRAKGETIADLADELKREVALASMNEILASLAEQTTKENVLENLTAAKEKISAVTRAHAPMSDVDLDADVGGQIEQMKQGMLLAKQGQSLGILTGIPHIDYHMGGLMPGQFTMVQGRTGSGKSYFLMMLGWAAKKLGLNVALFSPEFNAHEVRCRYHTLASADKDVQAACQLERSFRNSHLMKRDRFNLKSYQGFLDYLHEMPGSYHLLCGSGSKDQMSVGYIEDRLVEYQLDLVLVDPIYLLKPVRLHSEGNPYQEVAWIGETLHRLGETYQVPIVFTNQAHLDGNKGDAPSMDKSYGAKALLHLADWVLSVQHMSEENVLVVKANKGRFGEAFRLLATFVADSGFFEVQTPAPNGYRNGHHPHGEEVVRHAVGRKKRLVT